MNEKEFEERLSDEFTEAVESGYKKTFLEFRSGRLEKFLRNRIIELESKNNTLKAALKGARDIIVEFLSKQ